MFDLNTHQLTDSKTNESRILVVEDEFSIRLVIEDTLRDSGYTVIACDNAETAWTLLSQVKFDLLLVDLNLPRISGKELISKIRVEDGNVGIIVVSCHSDQESHDKCFDLGVDDYLDKPFSPRELLNRVQALIRRLPNNEKASWSHGNMRACFSSKQCWINEKKVELTALEFDLLAFFSQRQDCAISRQELLEEVWGMNSTTNTRSVDAFISSFRKKLESEGSDLPLESVRSVGYRLRSES